MTGRPRLVVALVVASLLAVILVYNGFVNAGTLLVSVAQLKSNRDGAAHKTVTLTGTVVHASGRDSPLRFVLKDDGSPLTVPVSYRGSVPDAFKASRHIIITGRLEDGVFVGQPDTLLTKCPSKYSSGGSG
ncbi:MAG TPA: cytochrome c maturation protein CcmE [Gaiellales bacterium]|jgi:cytochrome c-type biogenesis protein CcmE|nr:cytochrome c maturation protein CcmE [Gaiellales bacterium]